MKETIAEYARVVLVLIAFAVIGIFVLGGVWFNQIGASLNGVENEIQEERQQDILDKISERESPTLIVKGKTYTTGTAVKLTDLISEAKTYEEDSETEKSIKENVQIICDYSSYDENSKTLILETPGVYTIKYYVKDDFGLSTTKLVKIVAVDKALEDTTE